MTGSLTAFALYKAYSYNLLLEEKNLKLIQFYLDIKFISQCVSKTLSTISASDACNSLVDSIKNYYSFEDLLVFNSKYFTSGAQDTPLAKNVAIYINQSNCRIKDFLKNQDDFFIENFCYQGLDYSLYITATSSSLDSKEDGLIVSVDRHQNRFSKNEMICLKTSISLLKINISYL